MTNGKKIGKALRPPKAVPIDEFGLEDKNGEITEKTPQGRHSVVAYMVAWGMTDREISESLGISKQAVNVAKNVPHVKKTIAEIKQRIFERDPKRMLKEYLPKAVQTAADIMTDNSVKPGVRLNAAQDIMDRNLGKAAQKLDIDSSNLRTLMEKLDRHQVAGSMPDILAESRNVADPIGEKKEPEEKDLADTWAEEHLCAKDSTG